MSDPLEEAASKTRRPAADANNSPKHGSRSPSTFLLLGAFALVGAVRARRRSYFHGIAAPGVSCATMPGLCSVTIDAQDFAARTR